MAGLKGVEAEVTRLQAMVPTAREIQEQMKIMGWGISLDVINGVIEAQRIVYAQKSAL